MDLLPKRNEGYGEQAYWDERYTKEEPGATFDWFKTYTDIKTYLDEAMPASGKASRIVMLGCGNSTLSRDLYADGYKQVVNIDYSEVCIENMLATHQDQPEMKWLVGNVRSLPFENGTFDVAIDKGTMDALMTGVKDVWNPSEDIVTACREEIDEVVRILAPGGVFIYLTFGQPQFRKQHIIRPGWDLQIIEIGDAFHYYLYILRRCT